MPFIASLLIILFLSGCNRDDKVVAEANRHKLYLSEVRAQMPNGLSAEDSALLSQKVIDDWITEELILAEAEKQLSPKEKNFDHKSKLHFIVIHYSAIHDINYAKNG